ncbi:UNVERIFIED_CONTAM: hypothetical protein GTU68_031020 [Idotea baltica]|nr:hypothetical protein [Idotea baltica]
MWTKCTECKKVIHQRELVDNIYTCPNCTHHFRISAEDYFSAIFGDGENAEELFTNLYSADPLEFEDTKAYPDRVKKAQEKTGLEDAIRVVAGSVDGEPIVVAAMDFSFIGGSMGSVMGEMISRAIDHCLETGAAMMIISKSGGARMMEGALSLMQMAKISAKLGLLSQAKQPYISLLTDPTTGGVTASFAMLGDFNIAEPNALIGFAGPRVIKETIGKDLPKGFQRSEFLLEHGFLDFIVHRKDLREKIGQLLQFVK